MLVRTWSNRNPNSLQVGMQNGTAILEDDLTVSGSLLQGIAPCGAVLFGGSMTGSQVSLAQVQNCSQNLHKSPVNPAAQV